MRGRTLQTAFTTGVMDPRLAHRVKLEQYYQGLYVGKNVLCMPQGGVKRRPGTKYIANIGEEAVLGEFAFNTEQTYCMVFTDLNIAVYKDGVWQADIVSPWGVGKINDIRWCQSGDTMIIVHEKDQPRQLVRGATHTSWTLSTITLTNIPNYDFGSGPEASLSGTRGWPKTVCFYDNRLWFGGSTQLPQAIWSSKVGSYYDLNIGTGLDDEGIFTSLNTDQINAINGIFPGRHLQIFTTGGEFYCTVDKPTPGTFGAKRQTGYGSLGLTPTQVDGETIFIDRSGVGVRRFLYTELEQAYTADSISITAPHLLNNPRDIAIHIGRTGEEATYVYIVNGDGTMAVLNTMRSENISAWSSWETEGKIESVAVIVDEVYLVVRRTINGVESLYLELVKTGTYTDCCVYQGIEAPFSTITGLAHLNGESCRVRVDGIVEPDATPSGGSITLTRTVSTQRYAQGHEDLTTWDVGSVDVTPFALASPNGAETAFLLKNILAGSYIERSYGIPNDSNDVVESIYIHQHSASKTRFELYLQGGSSGVDAILEFDWATHTVSYGIPPSGTTAISTTDQGNGWWLIQVTCTNNSTGNVLATIRLLPAGAGALGAIYAWNPAVETEVGLDFNPEVIPMPMNIDAPDGPLFGEKLRLIRSRLGLYESNGVYVDRLGVEQYIPDRQFGESVLDQPLTPITGFKEVNLQGWDRDGQITIYQKDPLPFTLLSLMLEVKS